MAPGCSICRHQQRALIDVSLLREGTRFTARQFQVSRPSAIYTHGNFGKALDAQRLYMEQLLRMKPASESTQ